MANDKELKITSVFSSTGADKSTRDAETLRKAFEALSRAAKDTQRAMDSFLTGTKAETKAIQEANEALKAQTGYVENLRASRQRLAQASGWTGQTSFSNGIITDKPSPISGMQSGNGADWNPPGARNGINWSGIGKGMMKVGGVMGAVGAGVGVATNIYDSYWATQERRAQRDVAEKSMGMENLGRAQGFRNQMFFESRSAPQSWRAYKDMAQFNFATENTEKSRVDENGNIVGGKGLTSMRGGDLLGRAGNMDPEGREINAQRHRSWSGLGWGAAKMIGGAGAAVLGGGLALGGTAVAATGLGLLPGAAIAGGGVAAATGGVAAIFSGFKQAVDAWHGNIMVDKKLKEGELQAQQSEKVGAMDKTLDEVMAIQKYQMQSFSGSARAQMSAGQSALTAGAYQTAIGMSGLDEGSAVGLMSGLNRNFGTAGGGGAGLRPGSTLSSAYRMAAFHGMNAGGAANVSGAFKTLTGDSQALERIFAAGIKNGMRDLDMGFFEKLSAAAGKAGYSGAEGRMDPFAAAGALMGGRSAKDAFTTGEKVQGFGLASSMFQDNNYLKSRGMSAAMGILGPNAKGLNVGALNDASFTALAGKQGSEMLSALGITGAQRKAMLTSRINTLIDPLRPNLPGMKDNQSSSDYLQGLIKNLSSKSKKTRGGAEHDLARLAAVGSGTYGEEFGGMRGMFEAMGASPEQLKQFEKKGVLGKLPGGVTPGSASIELAGAAKFKSKDVKAGESMSRDMTTAEEVLKKSQEKHLDIWEGLSKEEQQQWLTGNEKQKGNVSQKIMQAYNHTEAGKAEAGGPQYQATQDLINAIKTLTETLKKPAQRAWNKEPAADRFVPG